MSMLPMFAVLLVGLGQAAPESYRAVDLPLTVKPLMPIPYFENKKLVSVSEYAMKKGDPIIRVFRYTYQAPYETEVKKVLRSVPQPKEWKEFESGDGAERDVKHEKVAGQAYVISNRKFVRDEKARAKTGVVGGEEGRKWVSISYNERLKAVAK